MHTLPVPSFMFKVYKIRNGMKEYQGCGLRIDDWLVSPTHVVQQENILIAADNGNLSEVNVNEGDWIEVASDMSAMKMPPTLMNLKRAKISGYVATPYVRVQAAMDSQNCSFGMLKNADAFGQTYYTGSTRGGFSGAAYMDVDKVYAIHQGGGAENYGLNAMFIRMRLAKMSTKPEDSELEAIKNAFKRTKDPRDWACEYSGSPGEYELRVGGQYWVVDDEMMEEIYADDYLADYFHYGEYEEDGRRQRKKPSKSKHAVVGEQEKVPEKFHLELGTAVMPEWFKDFEYRLQREWSSTARRMGRLAQAVEELVEEVREKKGISLVDKVPENVDSDEEPPYEVEQPEQQDFLEERLSSTLSSLSARLEAIEAQQAATTLTQNILTSQIQDCINGHQLLERQLDARLNAMFNSERQHSWDMCHQQFQSLMKPYSEQLEQTQSRLEDLRGQMNTDLERISEEFWERWTQRAQQASENSPLMQQSETHLGLMESAFQKYREWRNLNKPSSGNFITSRQAFLETLGLSTQEQARVVRRYANWWRGAERKRQLRAFNQNVEPTI